MGVTIGALLALSFLISVLGLFVFIWAQMRGLMRAGPQAAQVIFDQGELGVVEEPAAASADRHALQKATNANTALGGLRAASARTSRSSRV
jgi:cytochrome c oxidase cbb3-type subunit I